MSGTFSGVAMMVRRSLRQHALSSFITVVSVALATGLVMAVFGIAMNMPGLRYNRVGAGPTRFQRWFVPFLALVCGVLIMIAAGTTLALALVVRAVRRRSEGRSMPEEKRP